MSAILVAAAPLAASAQWPYPPYPSYYPAPPATPQSWSYDPYTSGLGPCPQRYPTDPPCSVTMHPTYGQPNYWPTR